MTLTLTPAFWSSGWRKFKSRNLQEFPFLSMRWEWEWSNLGLKSQNRSFFVLLSVIWMWGLGNTYIHTYIDTRYKTWLVKGCCLHLHLASLSPLSLFPSCTCVLLHSSYSLQLNSRLKPLYFKFQKNLPIPCQIGESSNGESFS